MLRPKLHLYHTTEVARQAAITQLLDSMREALRNAPSFWAMAAVMQDRGLDQDGRWFARTVREKLEQQELMALAKNEGALRKSRIIMPGE